MNNILRAKSTFLQQQDNSYDPFKRPPDFEFAERHGLANRFAESENDREKLKLCPCCGIPIDNELISICSNKSDLNFNGAGIPLYFEFIQFSIILLSILGLVSGIYNTIKNSLGDSCEQQPNTCSLNYYNKYALTNRDNEEDIILYILDLISTIFLIALTIYYRRWMNLTALEVDNSVITISDYSIQVSNLPFDATEKEILDFFSTIEKQGVTKQLSIQSICMGYNIKRYLDLLNAKMAKQVQIGNFIALEKVGKPYNIAMKRLVEQQVESITREIEKYEEHFENNFLFCGVAFITFNTSSQAKDCRKYHNQSKLQLLFASLYYCCKRKRTLKTFKGKTPYVQRAPEPGDIMWENLGENPWNQYKNQLWTNLATLFILGICFGAILGISIGQDEINNANKQTTNRSISFIITFLGLVASFVISFLNNIMAFTIKKLVSYEKPYTQTDFNISYANKLGMSQFINTAIIPLLVNLALTDDILVVRVWKDGGLNSDISLVLIMNAIFPWIVNLIDPFYLWKVFKRYRAKFQGNECTLTQREANLLFEGSKSDLSQKYATIVKSIMLTLFYSQLLPLGIPIAIAFLIINYWVEKVLLLRRAFRGPTVGKQLAEEMIDLYIELALVLFAAGNCIWQKIVVDEINPIVWAQLGISGFQLLIPVDWIFEWFIQTEDAETNETYVEKKKEIWDDYLKRNPVTQQKSIEKWIQEQGGEEKQNVQSFLNKLKVKQQQDMTAAQHNLLKKIVPKDMLDTNYKLRQNQVLPINNLEESLLMKKQNEHQNNAIKQAESIIYGNRETEIQNRKPDIKFSDSFTYD